MYPFCTDALGRSKFPSEEFHGFPHMALPIPNLVAFGIWTDVAELSGRPSPPRPRPELHGLAVWTSPRTRGVCFR